MHIVRIIGVLLMLLCVQRGAFGVEAAGSAADGLDELRELLNQYDDSESMQNKLELIAWELLDSPKRDAAVALMAPSFESGKVSFAPGIRIADKAIERDANISPLADFFMNALCDPKFASNESCEKALRQLLSKGDPHTIERVGKRALGNQRLNYFVKDYLTHNKWSSARFAEYLKKNGNSEFKFLIWKWEYKSDEALMPDQLASLEAFRSDSNSDVAAEAEKIWKKNYNGFGLGILEEIADNPPWRNWASEYPYNVGRQSARDFAIGQLGSMDPAKRVAAWKYLTSNDSSIARNLSSHPNFSQVLSDALEDTDPAIVQSAEAVNLRVFGVPPRPQGFGLIVAFLCVPPVVLLSLSVWASNRQSSRAIASVILPEFKTAAMIGIIVGIGVLLMCLIMGGIMTYQISGSKTPSWMINVLLLVMTSIALHGVSVALWARRVSAGMVLDTVMFCVLAGLMGAISALSVIANLIQPNGSGISFLMMLINAAIAIASGIAMFKLLRAWRNWARMPAAKV